MTGERLLPEEFPGLKTNRLILRALEFADAGQVQKLAGERDIAAATLLIPHPYLDGMAEDWIKLTHQQFKDDKALTWAITTQEKTDLIGAVGLSLKNEHCRAELGYWIGKPFWNKGYCTEAASAVLDFAFTTADLHKIVATYLRSNPASGQVMQKIGMSFEGELSQHVKKWDRFEDLIVYGLINPKHGG